MTRFLVFTLLLIFISCVKHKTKEEHIIHHGACDDSLYLGFNRALLASRFASLDGLKKVVQIDYINNSSKNMVRLTLVNCCGGLEIVSELSEGISQGDIIAAKDGRIVDMLNLLYQSPYSVANRTDLARIYLLARRRRSLFGWGDFAFFDLAKSSTEKIVMKDLAYKSPRDSSEKGYINSFNHITAQAIITSCFSEEMADFIADAHERYHMPELITGKFTEEQLINPEDNAVDNYVDMINNECGQELGKVLKKKYTITTETNWTPYLLANYLNDLQSYYSWTFQIGMAPFKPEEKIVIRYSNKLNAVLKRMNGVKS